MRLHSAPASQDESGAARQDDFEIALNRKGPWASRLVQAPEHTRGRNDQLIRASAEDLLVMPEYGRAVEKDGHP